MRPVPPPSRARLPSVRAVGRGALVVAALIAPAAAPLVARAEGGASPRDADRASASLRLSVVKRADPLPDLGAGLPLVLLGEGGTLVRVDSRGLAFGSPVRLELAVDGAGVRAEWVGDPGLGSFALRPERGTGPGPGPGPGAGSPDAPVATVRVIVAAE